MVDTRWQRGVQMVGTQAEKMFLGACLPSSSGFPNEFNCFCSRDSEISEYSPAHRYFTSKFLAADRCWDAKYGLPHLHTFSWTKTDTDSGFFSRNTREHVIPSHCLAVAGQYHTSVNLGYTKPVRESQRDQADFLVVWKHKRRKIGVTHVPNVPRFRHAQEVKMHTIPNAFDVPSFWPLQKSCRNHTCRKGCLSITNLLSTTTHTSPSIHKCHRTPLQWSHSAPKTASHGISVTNEIQWN